MREALGYVGNESEYAGSTVAEYGGRANGFAGKVHKFTHKLEAMKISVRNALIPAPSSVMDAIAQSIVGLSDLGAEGRRRQ